MSGLIQPCSFLHTTDCLGEICRILKPNGSMVVQEPVNESLESGQLKRKEQLISTIKLSGFVDISQVRIMFIYKVWQNVNDGRCSIFFKHIHLYCISDILTF